MFAFFVILGKLSRRISWAMMSNHVIGTSHLHNIPFAFYELHLHLCNSKCCQNACKMHVVQICFGHLYKCFSISSILLLHINECLMVVFNVFHKFRHSFSALMALVSVNCNAYYWMATFCFSPRHFVWHVASSSDNASCSNVISQSCICITPISSRNTSITCFAMLACFVEDTMVASCANRP